MILIFNKNIKNIKNIKCNYRDRLVMLFSVYLVIF